MMAGGHEDSSHEDGRIRLRDAADWGLVGSIILVAIALFLPVATQDGLPVSWLGNVVALLFLSGVVFATIGSQTAPDALRSALAELAAIAIAWTLPFALMTEGLSLTDAWGLWLFLLAVSLRLWRVLGVLAGRPGWTRLVLIPGLFGSSLLVLWKLLVRG